MGVLVDHQYHILTSLPYFAGLKVLAVSLTLCSMQWFEHASHTAWFGVVAARTPSINGTLSVRLERGGYLKLDGLCFGQEMV
jgi:hypothetical protein